MIEQLILLLKSLDVIETNTLTKLVIQVTAQTLAYSSSCINPLLYAFLSENFRKAFYKVSGVGALGGWTRRVLQVTTSECSVNISMKYFQSIVFVCISFDGNFCVVILSGALY